jgi:hypothetical protein
MLTDVIEAASACIYAGSGVTSLWTSLLFSKIVLYSLIRYPLSVANLFLRMPSSHLSIHPLVSSQHRINKEIHAFVQANNKQTIYLYITEP